MAKRTSSASEQARHHTVKRGPRAAVEDRYDLYQRAVQCVEAEIDFIDQTFTALRGRKAARLREDFCGTGNTSCEWVRRRRTNTALGLDLDPEPLAWGVAHNVPALTPAQRQRIELRRGDVLAAAPGAVGRFDAILAMNFSFWVFKARATMLAYFRAVRESLVDDGVLFTDFYGGSDALREIRERRAIKGGRGTGKPFAYIWDQEHYDPVTGDLRCHIHFRFPDGSTIRKAFSYDWRLWTLPEIRDILAEAGFSRTTVYWEGSDGKGGGNGVFTASEHGEACAAYICYLTAER